MVPKVKKSKKISRKRSPKKEVKIPIFVISKKESSAGGAKKHFFESRESSGAESLKIVKDGDDLPVLERMVSVLEGEGAGKNREEEVGKEWQKIKNQTHHKNLAVSLSERKEKRSAASLSEKHKRTIMWVSVVVLSCAIFFIWIFGLKNNFFEIFGSASYTFSRSEGALEEIGNSLEELGSQLSNSEEAPASQPAASSEEGIADKIKEKILVEELKSKLRE